MGIARRRFGRQRADRRGDLAALFAPEPDAWAVAVLIHEHNTGALKRRPNGGDGARMRAAPSALEVKQR